MDLAIQKCCQLFRKLSYRIFASSNSNNFRIKNITQTPVINLALQRILIQKLTFRVQLVKQQLLTVEIDIYGRLYLS